ncbi:MAG: DUF6477 family protein [Pseudorhodobacter sp.]
MNEIRQILTNLRRPRLLIRAARHGMQDYCRDRDLRRLFPTAQLSAPEAALDHLLSEEDQLEANRKAGDAAYSLTRHVDLLIALMAEARLLTQRAGA